MSVLEENLERFAAWVKERDEIRLRKLRGEPEPWTEDRILRKFRFCNVRRRDDRVSRWIINNVVDPYSRSGYLMEFLALGRFVNWPPTISALLEAGYTPDQYPLWEGMGKTIDRLAKKGKAWTGAYMIRAESNPAQPWYTKGKGEYICEIVLRGMFEDEGKMSALGIALAEGRRQAVHSVLTTGYGFGSFMAGQVIDDWTWTRYLGKATDLYSWAPQGPGSVRGMNRILNEPLKQTIEDAMWADYLASFRESLIERLGPSFEDLTAMDVQNCLCEFDKYERARLGQGRPRSIYSPETSYV